MRIEIFFFLIYWIGNFEFRHFIFVLKKKKKKRQEEKEMDIIDSSVLRGLFPWLPKKTTIWAAAV